MTQKTRQRIWKALETATSVKLPQVAVSTNDLVKLCVEYTNQKAELVQARRELTGIRRKINGRRPKAIPAST